VSLAAAAAAREEDTRTHWDGKTLSEKEIIEKKKQLTQKTN